MADFKKLQYQFASAIRNPTQSHDLDIESRRLRIYQDLIFNTIQGFIDSAFPVLKRIYNANDWLKIKQQFVANHQAQAPLFCQIAEEFMAFIKSEYETSASDPIFLAELAHYEWLELDVSLRPIEHTERLIDDINLQSLYLSKSAEIVSYPFAVHQISSDNQPKISDSEPTFLVVYRNWKTQVQFLQVNAVTAYLLDLIAKEVANNFSSLNELLQQALPQTNALILQQGLAQSLAELAELGILINND